MKLELYFLERQFRTSGRIWNKQGNIFMILGIIISVATLTIAFTIFDGYQQVLKDSILSTNSHIYVFNNSRTDLCDKDIDSLRAFFSTKEEIAAAEPVIINQVMATAARKDGSGKVISSQIRSVNWEKENLPIVYREFIKKGTWRLETDSDVVVGIQLAQRLGLNVGDEILLVSPAQSEMTLLGIKTPRNRYTIAGLYHSGIYESDSRIIFMREQEAWKFSNQPGRYSRMEIKLTADRIESADYLAYLYLNQLGLDYQFLSWQDFNSVMFNLLELEKWILFFILSFLIVVASFNVISTVSTEIIDHRRDIGILKTIGISNRKLRNIFLFRILGTGIAAIAAGELLGMLLSWVASVQRFFKLSGDVYFLDKVNVHFSPFALLLIFVTAMIIIFVAALIPLRQINRMEITGILRS